MTQAAAARATAPRTDGAGPVLVVGYDGSAASREALDLAARRAGRSGKVCIVHAYRIAPGFTGSANFDGFLSDHRDCGRALLDSILLTANDELLDTDFETELIEGPPAEAIADIARAEHAHAIFVGSRGLGSIRALLGSVSHELLHIAARPVVVVPAVSPR